MKKILLSVLVSTATLTTVSAQEFGFKKADKFIEGSFAFTHTEDEEDGGYHFDNVQFTPKLGYFVSDKFAVGAQISMMNVTEVENDIDNTVKVFSPGVFGRYYFLELGSKFKVYGEVLANYSKIETKDTEANVEVAKTKLNFFSSEVCLGAQYFITKSLAINYHFGDVIYFGKGKDAYNKNNKETIFNVNLNVFNNFFAESSFGLTYKF